MAALPLTIIMVLADTVMLRIDGQGSNTAIARAWIQQLEVSRARRSQGARGLGIGLLVGVAIGGIAGFADRKSTRLNSSH